MIPMSAFRMAMEKTAWLMPAITTVGIVAGMKSDAATNAAKSKLDNPESYDKYALQPPYAYQFGGGKNLPTQPAVGPMA